MNLRKYMFEFEDLPWFPSVIRESMTDYLRYVLTAFKIYQPITCLINETLINAQSNQIIDLCSGGGGAIEQVMANLRQVTGEETNVILTDKYPNKSAFEYLEKKTNGQISFSSISIDASAVPLELKGIRTIFSGFHHFDKPFAKLVIRNAVDSKAGIGIFDGGEKNILAALGNIIFHPIVFLLFTPFFRPFRLSRLIFTYFIPVIPICTIWDGVMSTIRLYQPKEFLKMAEEVDNKTYTWKAGKVRSKYGLHVSYLIGYPKHRQHKPILPGIL